VAKLINHRNIDINTWDQLVLSDHRATIFNYSYYINALAEDWDLYTDENYSYGIIVPFKKILNQRIAYTPFFYRYSDLVGNSSKFEKQDFIACLNKNYDSGNLNLSFPIHQDTRVFQVVNQLEPKSLAKRQIKKASKLQLDLSLNSSNNLDLINLIFEQLSQKIELYRSVKYKERFLRLTNELNLHSQLIVLSVFDKDKLIGGLIGMKNTNRMIYLKGTCLPFFKKQGLMYLMMNKFIQYAESENLDFDFGGSSDENVRFFNTRFNGIDQSYYVYNWENNPQWFKILKQVKEWKKK
jgi:hypothetical protein